MLTLATVSSTYRSRHRLRWLSVQRRRGSSRPNVFTYGASVFVPLKRLSFTVEHICWFLNVSRVHGTFHRDYFVSTDFA